MLVLQTNKLILNFNLIKCGIKPTPPPLLHLIRQREPFNRFSVPFSKIGTEERNRNVNCGIRYKMIPEIVELSHFSALCKFSFLASQQLSEYNKTGEFFF